MTNIPVRGAVTVIVWLSYLTMLYILAEQLGIWVTLLAFVLMIPLIVVMGATWNMFGTEGVKDKSNSKESSTEKRKRERIDTVLRDLSDDDLMLLRQRLQDGTIDEDVLYDHMVGDDGELIQRN